MTGIEVILNSDVFNPKEFTSKEEAMAYAESLKQIPHMMNIEIFDYEAEWGGEDCYIHLERRDGKWERL